ncbi:hypothetical protein FB45DRAFT_925311 [Roridomyces roridus]|uniref:Uncharacterized protein n=1 Tax=Roridomyces roridus TaxID=1738132 RepID=A0AAD7BJR2_9AGAR|nr:hypothetical protein FB45DRAFT_925311 [Roridomyces roridus]
MPQPARPNHKHSDSSPPTLHPEPASRIMSSVRRTLAKRRDPQPVPTFSEQRPPTSFRYDPTAARPTVEQIALGLHLSRTPHIRGGSPKYPAPATLLPPPPARSSLKKPALGSSSSTDITSTTPSTPHSSDRSNTSLRTRFSRFLPVSARGPLPQSTASSPRTSSSDLQTPRKKAVRFSSTVKGED